MNHSIQILILSTLLACGGPPDVAHPILTTSAGQTYTFSRPGNWSISRLSNDGSRDEVNLHLGRDSMFGSQVFVRPPNPIPAQLAVETVQHHLSKEMQVLVDGQFSEYGGYLGHGIILKATVHGQEGSFRIFSHQCLAGTLLIIEGVADARDKALFKPGFDLIEGSLTSSLCPGRGKTSHN